MKKKPFVLCLAVIFPFLRAEAASPDVALNAAFRSLETLMQARALNAPPAMAITQMPGSSPPVTSATAPAPVPAPAPGPVPEPLSKVEQLLSEAYVKAAEGCGGKLNAWFSQKDKNDEVNAGVNTGGAVVTLLGAIAPHAALKTFLTGFGLTTATSDGQGVAGGVAKFFGARSQADQTEMDRVRAAWSNFQNRYSAVDAASDVYGFRRQQLIASVSGDCVGLYTPASGPGPTPSPAPAPAPSPSPSPSPSPNL